jgi:amino acid transporter
VGIGKAILWSLLLLLGGTYILLAYTTVISYGENVSKLTAAPVPFVDAAHGVASFLAFLAYIAGFTSIFGTLLSAANSQARIIFNSGRGEIGTMGTILVIVTYLVANPALPVYYRKYHPEMFNPVRHLLLPVLGAFAVGDPLYELIKPGQPAPFSTYPWIAPGVIVVAAVWAAVVCSRDRTLGERVGSIIADD